MDSWKGLWKLQPSTYGLVLSSMFEEDLGIYHIYDIGIFHDFIRAYYKYCSGSWLDVVFAVIMI